MEDIEPKRLRPVLDPKPADPTLGEQGAIERSKLETLIK